MNFKIHIYQYRWERGEEYVTFTITDVAKLTTV